MSERLELLSSAAHGGVRMRPYVEENHPHFVNIVIQEFIGAATSCPIFFAKDAATGQFYAAALFGFQPGEMLADTATYGESTFKPLELQRQGFLTSGENIAIDEEHARFGRGATLALFGDDGTPSNALRQVQRTIGELVGGIEATRAFIAEMLRLKLIEPVDISLSFDDGQRLSLDGLYTISREGLSALDDSVITTLFRSGYLQAALCMSMSLSQIGLFAERRNARLTARP